MNKQFPKGIRNNLRFLLIEISTQLSNLQNFIGRKENISASHILDRNGYTENLKQHIQNACYQHMAQSGQHENEKMECRAINSIAFNLERISELCRDCTQQVAELGYKQELYSKDYIQLLDKIAISISLIERAILDSSTNKALKIAEIQKKSQTSCEKLIDKHAKTLKKQKKTQGLIASLFVTRSIKSMTGCLLRISEAILSANLGQQITLDRYHSLNDFVSQLQKQSVSQNLVVETLAETRSGSAISGISTASDDQTDIIAVFKDGKKRKLKEELKSVKQWNKLYPGIAPKILSYHKKGQSAALLIEHLEGTTFENILLESSLKSQQKAIKQLTRVLADIWKKTRITKSVNAQYIKQLQKRLPDVYAIHPEFKQAESQIAGLTIDSFQHLLNQAQKLEQNFAAPFSVHIHGDFNTDNIIYQAKQNKINFIDLHRSCEMDYVQDISVFMVSNYRLQTLEKHFRHRVLLINQSLYEFANEFAVDNNDPYFNIRLLLGLARSLATSPRFTLDKSLAEDMFYRSRYLIEQLLKLEEKDYSHYQAPIKEIFVG